MSINDSSISELNSVSAYIIFTDGIYYFIPGQKEDNEYFGLFDSLASKYYPSFDFSLGAGWLFDKGAIEKIKQDFENEQVNYAEITLSRVSMHRFL